MNHNIRKFPWIESTDRIKTPESTAIVTVNYNTKSLIIQLIWSIYGNLGANGFGKIVVVDNKSSDGSQEILRALDKEGLIDYLENSNNLYHGPALNQAFDYLSENKNNVRDARINSIWVLDSDCIVLRPDTLKIATEQMTNSQAAVIGQPVEDKWHQGDFGLHSLLIDPAKVWRDPIHPFEEHGEPSKRLQESCVRAGLVMIPFKFTADKYIIHLGRGTLSEIAKSKDKKNRYFEWAQDHFNPHFAGELGIENVYKEFQKEFIAVIPNINVKNVIRAFK